MRTHTELQMLDTLEERFDYLSVKAAIGFEIFGFERWLNQAFYNSREWKLARRDVIARDMGLEFGVRDVPIIGRYYVHHMNPLSPEDIEYATDNLLDPEFLVCCGLRVHNAVHFGDKSQLPQPFIERQPNDTFGWRN